MSEPPEYHPTTGPKDPVDDLLASLLHEDPEDHARALKEACEKSPAHASVLRRRYDALVEAGLVDTPSPSLPTSVGEFELLECIGQGGMGVVHRARQASLNREVAVKLVRPEELRFAGARERFSREVTTIARLSHPGIVPVYAVGEEDGVPYFAMELVRGETLAALMDELGGVPVEKRVGAHLDRALAACLGEEPAQKPAAIFEGTWETTCLRILRAVADALQHAHALGVFHRDLKPSNVMLTRAGRVMLLDFGLSNAEGSERLTRTGMQVGSLAYMAPEVLTGRTGADRRSDVYGLGVTLYELLSGGLPYFGDTLGALREKVLEARPRGLRTNAAARRRVSWEAETICLAALDRDPDRRYATAGELARDLSNALDGQPIEARRPGFLLRTRRFAARHPAWSAGLALLALMAPITWAVQERRARMEIATSKVATDRANEALEQSLQEVRRFRQRADEHFSMAVDAVDRMLDRVGDEALRDLPQMAEVRRDVLNDALAFHEGLVRSRPTDPSQRLRYVKSLRRVGDIQSLLGELDLSVVALDRAGSVLEEWIDSGPSADVDPEALRELGRSAWRLMESEDARGNLEEAVRVGRETCERLAVFAQGTDVDGCLVLAQVEAQLGRSLQRMGRSEEGREVLLASVEGMRRLRSQGLLTGEKLVPLANTLTALGTPDVYHHKGSKDQADLAAEGVYLDEALELRRAVLKEFGTSAYRFALAESLINVGANRSARSSVDVASAALGEAGEMLQGLVHDFPSVAVYRDALATTQLNLGNIAILAEDRASALAAYGAAVETYEDLHARQPGRRGLGVRRLAALQSLVRVRLDQGLPTPEVMEMMDTVLDLGRRLLKTERGDAAVMTEAIVTSMMTSRGKALAELGQLEAAAEHAWSMADTPRPDPEWMLAASAILSICVANAPFDSEQALDYTGQAIDVLARALDAGPQPALLTTYLKSTAFNPLRGDPVFAELLGIWGLERWAEPNAGR